MNQSGLIFWTRVHFDVEHHRTAALLAMRVLSDALAACCGFDLCHKYILYLNLYFGCADRQCICAVSKCKLEIINFV
jgi:hypothetical protein